MKTIALVPAKDFASAKSRLAVLLSPEERAVLAGDMLRHVLSTLRLSGVVDELAVISPEPHILELEPGINKLRQERPGLNVALEQGREWAIKHGADALIVAFADLPCLSPNDVRDIVYLGDEANTVVLAPDRHYGGTNLMLLHPPDLLKFSYGPGSYIIHSRSAAQAGIQIEVYRSPGTSLDIDTPEDYALLEKGMLLAAG